VVVAFGSRRAVFQAGLYPGRKKSPTKINDTTEPILARSTLTNGIEKLMVDYFQCSHLAERLVPKMLSRVMAFQHFRNQSAGGNFN